MDSFIRLALRDCKETDAVIGILSTYPFTGFEEDEQDLIAYISYPDWNSGIQDEILNTIQPFASSLVLDEIPFENWNKMWEENYPEVEIDEFCRIYAPFHGGSGQKFRYEILISPQMAFGTGHHPTTEMMIRLMSHLPEKIQDGTGLDFGAGSGVLAILASKMGASRVDAVEIDGYAFQNLTENVVLNEADWVFSFPGGVEQVPKSSSYDFILANVTKNIILEHNLNFFNMLKPDGRIIVSGILDKDQDEVHNVYIRTGFHGLESMKIGHWTALMFGKRRIKS